MRRLVSILAGVVTSAVLAVPPAAAMSFEEARHLASRTGYAPTLSAVQLFQKMERDQAVDWLLANTRPEAATPPPGWTKATPQIRPPRGATTNQKRAFRIARRQEALSLRAWWYAEMVRTPSPLTERMTLFWHNHFASSVHKVGSPTLMFRQNALLRQGALGSFRDLVHAVAKDPAMVIYLDNVANRKDAPNENFARELLERFTLGEGHYTEQDIKQAARAFTGWSVDRETGDFFFRIRQHDGGIKQFMWQSGHFNGDDIINIVLEKDRVAVYITEKMWRAFVSETPDADAVQRISLRFRSSNYDIKVLLGALLKSNQFWDARARGRLVKSPVDLIAGTMRQFEIPVPSGRVLRNVGNALGQDIFAPPNVAGWPGGARWITANTLLIRQQMLRRLARSDDMSPRRMRASTSPTAERTPRARPGAHLERWIQSIPASNRRPRTVAALLLPVKPVNRASASTDPARFIRALILDPAYQLK